MVKNVVCEKARVGLADYGVFALVVLRARRGGAEGLGVGGHEGGAGGEGG